MAFAFHSVVLERASGLWKHHDLALGIEGIDTQHAWLVAVILELEWVLNRESEGADQYIAMLIQHAKSYAAEHFNVEEELFRRLHYSDEEHHVRSHRNFIQAVEKVAPGSYDRAGANKLYRLLRMWLVHHILQEDRGYAEYFKKRRLLDDANKLFEEIDQEKHVLDDYRRQVFKTISGSARNIEVTTPEIQAEIASIWKRLNLQIQVPLIDIQHLWLIKLVVDMDQAMRDSKLTRDAVLAHTIAEASEYIDVHFRTEEQLMDIIEYPDKARHQATHRKFVEFVQQRRKELESGNTRAAMTLVNDLRQWLTNHIALDDKTLAEHYRNHREAALAFSKEKIVSGEAHVRRNQINLYQIIVKKQAV